MATRPCDLATQRRSSGCSPATRSVEEFFAREAPRLAEACREMAERFLRGGRLLAFGRGPYATDAQHVSVEFVHPVIVGKRALPALDSQPAVRPVARGDRPAGRHGHGLRSARGRSGGAGGTRAGRAQRGAMTFALPGPTATMRVAAGNADPFIHQELIEILYHTLWETVHVFFEHRELGHDVGQAGFLYPFLGREKQATDRPRGQVARRRS